jgi:hypothetical protein
MINQILDNTKYLLKNDYSFIIKEKYCSILDQDNHQMAAFSVYKEQIAQIVNHIDNPYIVLDVIKLLLNDGYSIKYDELYGLNLLLLNSDLFNLLSINSSKLDIINFNDHFFLNISSDLDYESDKIKGISFVKVDDYEYEKMIYSLSMGLHARRRNQIVSAIVDCFLKNDLNDLEYEAYKRDIRNYNPVFLIWTKN